MGKSTAPAGKRFTVGYFIVRTIFFPVCCGLVNGNTSYKLHPVSAGRVHIKSGLDAYAPLDFEPGYLDESAVLPPI